MNSKSRGAEWKEVQGRRGLKREKIKSKREERILNTTTFFVSNLPAGCSSNRLWRAFVHLGNLEDAFVPRKLNRAGNGFGFIRFSGIFGVNSWISTLKDVTVDGVVIEINVAKYGRDGKANKVPAFADGDIRNMESSKGREHLGKQAEGRRHVPYPSCGRSSRKVESGGSFKQVLLGCKSAESRNISIVLPKMDSKAKREWSGRSLIGEVFNLEIMDSLRTDMFNEKMMGATVRFVGGLKIMLTFGDSLMADEFRRSQFDLWSQWFSRSYAWEGELGEYERLAWIIVKGIPACLWDRHVFDGIGERVGRLIQKLEASVGDGNISQDKLVVLVKHGTRISKEIDVNRNGLSFRVWVDEVDESWVPSFLLPASSNSTPLVSVSWKTKG
ncbi:hypothetical protein L1987_50195 [Smallanthus sonchifolius]|uniref:Uncharacterized protein n=1 Tax=Smallanthus sonchifolius TaxID=185202 RepID=A0ACB9FW51_9ASTR|nr:hypothetical protein L1987_50195 [Smallanthus sonchifolius]